MRILTTIGLVHLIACESDKSLTVQNPAPTADIISHDDGSEILEGFAVTLEGVVSDSNHTPDQLTTRWVINGEVVCDDIVPDEDGSTFCETVFDTDETEISLEVRDAEQKFGSDTINVVIVETEAPIAEIITPISDGVYYSDQKIAFEGLVSDAEDDADQLVAYWESDIDGVLSDVDSIPDSAGTVLGYGYLTEGEHAIELHVEDTTGKPDTESVFITVGPPNSAPLCEISSPEDGAAGPEGELVTFAGTVSDVDVPASYLSIEWSSDKDGVLGPSTPDSSGNVSFPFANLSVNTHVISMTVTDEVGAECVANRTYTVGTAPSITIDAPTDGDVINEGTPITFSATVSDAQDQANDVTLDWVANGSSISTQGATSSGEATFSNNTLTYGTYNLVVTATDTDGLTDSDQINFTVNGVPTAPVISINPDPATTSDGLSVSIDTASVDPEGNTPTYSYEWQLGGQVQSSYTTSTLPSSATSKGEQWTVIVTPNDGITDGTPASASITIANTAPTLSGLSITPTGTTYNDDTLTCAATVTDPDESPAPTFEWTVGGNVIGASATLDLTATDVMPDDVLTCTVIVSDSDSATATDSITRTVTNRAPTLASTTINPSTNVTTDTLLTCSTTVTDADGESLTPTYTWSVGANNNAGTGTTLQLTPSMGNPGDGIVCTVDVADGYGGTAVDTAVTTITNTDPVVSDVSLSYTGDLTSTTSLTCNHTATDADNQMLTPTYTWTNLSTNTQFSSTASTLQLNPTTVSPTDVVECSVTVTDTSNGSATLAASETVLNTDPTFITPATVTTSGTQVGDTWTCYAAGTDQDDGTLTPTYEWQDANGVFVASGASLTLSSSNSAPNADLTCVATLTDTLNATATSSASATVTNTAPTFDVSASIAPNTGVVTASLLTCSGSASDADGDTPTVSYAWSNSNGTVYGSTGNTLQLTPSTVTPADVVTCTLTATDASGETATSSASVTVDNTLPTLTAAISANGTSNTGELTCSATASDLDDFPVTPILTYEWFNSNGSLGTSNPLQLDPTMGVDGDTIECTATATDLSGGSATDTASMTITNTAPVIDIISLNPSTIDVNTSSVTCVVSSSDADGDTVTESFEWYVDGNLQSETTNMYSGPFLVGSLLACRSTPNDGKTDGDFVEDTATIQNTAPVVDSVTLSPSTVYTNDTITATATLSDADAGQNLTANFEWFVDGSSVQNGASNTLDGVSMFSRDQSVYVEVTPNDGVTDGTAVQSSAITVSNTAPVLSSVTVTPDPAAAGQDDLTCDVTATDADGDAILYTYEWSDSSGVQQTMTEVSDVSDTFLAAGLVEDTWTCDVTPYDGTDYGASVSGSATVESGCSSLYVPSGTYAEIAGLAGNLPTGDACYEAWVNIDNTQNDSPYLMSILAADNTNFGLRCSYGNLEFWQETQVTYDRVLIPGFDCRDGQWHHIAGCKQVNGTSVEMTLYWDGVLVGSSTGATNTVGTNTSVYIGRYPYAPAVGLGGYIDKIQISNTLKYSSEFSPDTNMTSDSSTVAFYEFASLSGSTFSDLSGNNYSGEVYGATLNSTCPEEDLDGDGVAAWEDCDDNDASIPTVDDLDCNGIPDDCYLTSCDVSVEIGNGIGADFVLIDDLVDPLGRYTLEHPFYMMTTEVTQGMYIELMGYDPRTEQCSSCGSDTGLSNGPNYPVYFVDWHQAAHFANQLSALEGLNECYSCTGSTSSVSCVETISPLECTGYSLPTEGETELASRSGTTADFWTGSGSELGGDASTTTCTSTTFIDDGVSNPLLSDYANYCNNQAIEVAQLLPNGFGLYDMHGNVHEWIADYSYCTIDTLSTWCDASNAVRTSHRKLRSGDWGTTEPEYISNSFVGGNAGSTHANRDYGFRLRRLAPIDNDGDGYHALEDCDDSDALVWDAGSGASSACAATSCNTILADGFAQLGDDGNYWIDPDGNGAFEVYCDMTTDGGGWTNITSWDISNRSDHEDYSFFDNQPVNEDAFNWDNYRLSKPRIDSLFDVSNDVHIRCHRDFNSSQSDYLFGNVELIRDVFYQSGGYNTQSCNANPHDITAVVKGYSSSQYCLSWSHHSYFPSGDCSSSGLPVESTSEDFFGVRATQPASPTHLCALSQGEFVYFVR